MRCRISELEMGLASSFISAVRKSVWMHLVIPTKTTLMY